MEIRDENRPQVLNATEAAMRNTGGLLDPDLIERVAADSSVHPDIITQRWRTGDSLIADVVSDKGGIATPGWPQATNFAGATTRTVLTALASAVAAALNDDQLTRAALSQVIASPTVRRVWSDFVAEDLEQWTAILVDTTEPHAPIDRERAARPFI